MADGLWLGMLAVCSVWLRVVGMWDTVFGAGGTQLVEPDAYFHVRTVQALVRTWPKRLSFDPYLLSPGGQDVATGGGWDYLLAGISLVVGVGHPSEALVEQVAAWTPALLGGLLPLLGWWMGWLLGGRRAGWWAALIAALTPGYAYLVSKLGFADHHALEAVLAPAAILVLATGTGWRSAVTSGILAGCYLWTRPAGIFVPIVMTAAALLERAMVGRTAVALAVASWIWAMVAIGPWMRITWLVLGACLALVVAVWWQWRWRWGMLAAIAVVGMLVDRGAAQLAVHLLLRMAGLGEGEKQAGLVNELLPAWKGIPGSPWLSVWAQMGWTSLLGLAGVEYVLWKQERKRGFALLSLWALAMAVGGLLQVRMGPYWAVAGAATAGCLLAALFDRIPARLSAVSTGLVMLVLASGAYPVLRDQARGGMAPGEDWQKALQWLKTSTPEPYGDPQLWYGRGGRLPGGYGIAVWWDYGYWVEYLAHRIPITNGTQAQAQETAELLLETDPQKAAARLARFGARYVVLNDTVLWSPVGQRNSSFEAMTSWANRQLTDYVEIVWENRADGPRAVLLYKPEYYRSFGVRLYLEDGKDTTEQEAWLVRTREEGGKRFVVDSRRFGGEKEALAFLRQSAGGWELAGYHPSLPCVHLEPLPKVRLVYQSRPWDKRDLLGQKPVKIFQLE